MRPTLQRFGIEEKLCGGMGFQITSLLLLFLCLPRVRLPKSDDDDGVYSREARIIFPFICSRWESIIDFVGHHHAKTRRQSICRLDLSDRTGFRLSAECRRVGTSGQHHKRRAPPQPSTAVQLNHIWMERDGMESFPVEIAVRPLPDVWLICDVQVAF